MDITVKSISKFLNKKYYGKNFIINKVSSINDMKQNSVTFLNKKKINKDELKFSSQVLLLCYKGILYNLPKNISYIETSNPKLDYTNLINFFFKKKKYKIHKSSIIHKTAQISKDVTIGCYSVIGKNVKINENTEIGHHVIISDDVVVGKNCHIKSGAILGEKGFGLAFDDNKIPVDILHLGSLEIQDNVSIGSNTIINRGTINNTIIKNNAKIDDDVFIAHNCLINENVVIVAKSELSGSCIIGKNSWIGPGSRIIQKTKIGANVIIGIGSIIRNDIEDNQTVQSLEALNLRELVKLKKLIKSYD
jgi:UDP-3-O-[3-hydroxymyristoyl] glucosamine N-acyltransferase